MIRTCYMLHALSPLHAGTGQAIDVVDLPIARMQSTGIPIVPGSSVKGVLRDALREASNPSEVKAIFGPDTGNADHSGAVNVGDARLLALPVRSFRGVFVWATSPLLLTLAARDLELEGAVQPPGIPALDGRMGSTPRGIPSVVVHGGRVYLQDLDITVKESNEAKAWAELIAGRALPPSETGMFTERFVVLDDETMSYLWTTATQIDARNSLDDQGVVKDGALWYEESLPPETLLIGSLAAHMSRDGSRRADADVLAKVPRGVMQFGGKATVGRGLCRFAVGGA